MAEQLEKTEELAARMETLREKGIVSFDIGESFEEQEAIKNIRIEKALPQFNYYGPANETLIQQLQDHLSQLEGNMEESLEVVARLVARVARDIQEDFHKESVWVIVRATVPNGAFDVPRWHKDGNYVQRPDDEEYKLVFTLKGPRGRFAEITHAEKYTEYEQKYIANDDENQEEDLRIRKAIDTTVAEIGPIPEGFATMYRVGEEGKVHSEPPMDESRLFVSVVVGSTEEIEKLKTAKGV